jgi:hypothetical protein
MTFCQRDFVCMSAQATAMVEPFSPAPWQASADKTSALWTQVGPTATFGLGAWMGATAFGLLVDWWPWLKPNGVPWPQDPEEVEHRQESRFE